MTNDETIHIRMGRRLVQELDAQAKRTGKTRTALVREAAEQFLSDSRLAAQITKGQADHAARLASLGTVLETMALQVSDLHEYTLLKEGGQ